MNTAQTIIAAIPADAVAVTLAGGYAVARNGSRVLFPTGRLVAETRNRAGRCRSATFTYADGSGLRFTWSDAAGPRYAVIDAERRSR